LNLHVTSVRVVAVSSAWVGSNSGGYGCETVPTRTDGDPAYVLGPRLPFGEETVPTRTDDDPVYVFGPFREGVGDAFTPRVDEVAPAVLVPVGVGLVVLDGVVSAAWERAVPETLAALEEFVVAALD
jgi:hypothetical protein